MPFLFQFSPAEDYAAKAQSTDTTIDAGSASVAQLRGREQTVRDYIPKAGSIASYLLNEIPTRLTSAHAYANEGNARAASDILAEVQSFRDANRDALEKMARYNGNDQTRSRVAQTSMSLLDGSYMTGSPKEDGSPDKESIAYMLVDEERKSKFNALQSQLGTANADVNALSNNPDAKETWSLLNEDLFKNSEVQRVKRAGGNSNAAPGMGSDQLILSAKTLSNAVSAMGDEGAATAYRSIRGNCRTAEDVRNYMSSIQTLVGEDTSVDNVSRASSRLGSLFKTYMATRGNLATNYSTGTPNSPSQEQYAAFSSAVSTTVNLAKRIGVTDGETMFAMLDYVARSNLVSDIERAERNGLLSIVDDESRKNEMEVYYAKKLSTVYADLAVPSDLLTRPSKIEVYNDTRDSLSSRFVGPTPPAATQIDPKTGKEIEVANAADAMMTDHEAMGKNMLSLMFSSLDQLLAPAISTGTFASSEEAMNGLLADDAFRARAADIFKTELRRNGMLINDDDTARMMVSQAFDLAKSQQDGTIDFDKWAKAVTTVPPDVKDAELAHATKRYEEITRHKLENGWYRPGEDRELAGYQVTFMGLDPKATVDVDGKSMTLEDLQLGLNNDTHGTAAHFFTDNTRASAVKNYRDAFDKFFANEIEAKTKKTDDGEEVFNDTSSLTDGQKFDYAVNSMMNNPAYTASVVVYDTGRKDQDGKNIQLTLGDVISFANRSPVMQQQLAAAVTLMSMPAGAISEEEAAGARNTFNSIVESTVRNCLTITSTADLDMNRQAYAKSIARDFAYADVKVMANLQGDQIKEYESLKKQVIDYMAKYYDAARENIGKKQGTYDPRYDVKLGLGMYADNASIGRAFSDTMSIMSNFEDGYEIVGKLQELIARSVAGEDAAKYVRGLVKTENIYRRSNFVQLSERLKRNAEAMEAAKTRRFVNTTVDGVMDVAGILTGIAGGAKTAGSRLLKWAAAGGAALPSGIAAAGTTVNWHKANNAIETFSPAFDSGIGDAITIPEQFNGNRPGKSGELLWARYLGNAVSMGTAGAVIGGGPIGFAIGAGIGLGVTAATEIVEWINNNTIDEKEYSNISYSVKGLFNELMRSGELSEQARERVRARFEETEKKASELYDSFTAWNDWFVNAEELKSLASLWANALSEATRELTTGYYSEAKAIRDNTLAKMRYEGRNDAERLERFARESNGDYVGVSPNGACTSVAQASANMRMLYNYSANKLTAKNSALSGQIASEIASSIPGLTAKDEPIARNLAASALAEYDQAVMSGKTENLPANKTAYVKAQVYQRMQQMAANRHGQMMQEKRDLAEIQKQAKAVSPEERAARRAEALEDDEIKQDRRTQNKIKLLEKQAELRAQNQ